jgi:hypothetical protein
MKGPQLAGLSRVKKEILQNPHWMAGDPVLIAAVSRRIPC